MSMNMDNFVYWLKNQVVITFYTNLIPSATKTDAAQRVNSYLTPLNNVLKGINVTLEKVDLVDVSLFPSPTRTTDAIDNTNAIVAFFHIVPDDASDHTMDTILMSDDTSDHTMDTIHQLNTRKRDFAKDFPSFDVAPHWHFAGTDYITQGCPVGPPFPVEKEKPTTPDQWKLQFSQIPEALQAATGKDVTVFVLDAFPSPTKISQAAEAAGDNNRLLQKMATGIQSREPFNAVPPAINIDYLDLPQMPQTVVTGKDIYGRHAGFSMADHGMFVTGIVRDLAHDANIECIRVLDDFGVGVVKTLIEALVGIQYRMLPKNPATQKEGDLYLKPVVINLSLVVGPPESDMQSFGLDKESVKSLLKGLYAIIRSLTISGAIFVASAGNDTDPRMNQSEMRFWPRYPAAFADDDSDPKISAKIIPVGAVNQLGKAASYSNYPGPNGIATYGGDLPEPDPWLPSAVSHVVTHVDTSDPIDALRGVYTAPVYPALSKNDHYPPLSPKLEPKHPEYPAPNSNAWAYWSGTSFATPIISALAARVLENQTYSGESVQETIISIAQEEKSLWTGLEESGEDASGHLIIAMQE
jgi:subtilase family protein